MRGNWNGALTEVWESSLDLAASFAEGYARVNRRGCGGCRQPGCPHCFAASQPHCRGEGDFLADWIHLNLSHISQVARLSAAYSGVAARALERFYSCFDPCEPGPSAQGTVPYELRLVGHGTAYGLLNVRNTFGVESVFEVEGNSGGYAQVDFYEVGAPATALRDTLSFMMGGAPLTQCRLAPNEAAKITVSLGLGQFTPGRQYRATICGVLGGRGRSPFNVLVDVL
jgi:hypothetical protein